MQQPVLVIMAAGLGSRYGGLKQLDPIDEQGHLIIDYSLFDAYRAGFRSVIFIIKPEMEQDFKAAIANRISKSMKVSFAFQRLDDLPDGYTLPPERVKPWGTGHAILSCRELIDAPFAVLNADDYYGREAFEAIFRFLSRTADTDRYHFAMVGYRLENTLTEFGSVARGVCEVTPAQMLHSVTERTRIEKHGTGAAYTEDDGASWIMLPSDAIVSMNLWGFTPSILTELQQRFPAFLEQALSANPLKAEYFLPSVVNRLLDEQKADVRVLTSSDKWYGVTYKEDRASVTEAIRQMKQDGLYPSMLWEKGTV